MVRTPRKPIKLSPLQNSLIHADNLTHLKSMPDESVDLIFTSPPYYNVKPEYAEYHSYDTYLGLLESVIQECHRVLYEGRYIVINIAPVLIPRQRRNDQSRRIAIPFDLHQLLTNHGYDFFEDIIWMKSTGNGWNIGRNRSFMKHRKPLGYRPNPITEYILVYRKHTTRLSDWNINNHPDQDAVKRSEVPDGYEESNVWNIHTAHSPYHPAVFPIGLAERVVRYYSFEGDVVLDPYAGIGTVAQACINLNRRYVMIERKKEYFDVMVDTLTHKDTHDMIVE